MRYAHNAVTANATKVYNNKIKSEKLEISKIDVSKGKRLIDLMGSDCELCVKKAFIGNTNYYECTALAAFYFVQKPRQVLSVSDMKKIKAKGCWSLLKDIKQWYMILKNIDLLDATKREEKRDELSKLEIELEQAGFSDWLAVYKDELRRGGGGGASEKNENREASMKQKMKDNRPQECKLTKSAKEEIKSAMVTWEEENGKLERLGRCLLSKTKVDSYTGDDIE